MHNLERIAWIIKWVSILFHPLKTQLYIETSEKLNRKCSNHKCNATSHPIYTIQFFVNSKYCFFKGENHKWQRIINRLLDNN